MSTTDATSGPRPGSGAMFDDIAPRYDLLNRLMSLGIDQRWRKKAVEALGLGERARVLDLATGTADLAIAIAKQHRSAEVDGVDPSEKMLAVGRDKLERGGLDKRVRLGVGEAEKLPFDDGSFDGVTIAFGIRNVPDRLAGLREMCRVTKPGGRVVVLELSEPERGIMSGLAKIHVHHVVPAMGALLSGSREYAYLQKSIAAFPPAEAFGALMREAGLEVERIEALTFGVAHLYVAKRPL
jgi:demethylmenaquinone methyltransferase / 2-methoxy-6-polyprenyl-1,4-benzoquinol methylase